MISSGIVTTDFDIYEWRRDSNILSIGCQKRTLQKWRTKGLQITQESLRLASRCGCDRCANVRKVGVDKAAEILYSKLIDLLNYIEAASWDGYRAFGLVSVPTSFPQL